MNISSIEDIIAIDGELASLFLRPEEAINWIYNVENGIKGWIHKNNKQYWEIVRFVSEERGILGKLRKDGKTVWLKREDFARVLLKFCPNAFEKGETTSALKTSMEHYEFASIWRNLDKQPDAHIVRHHIKEVEDLLDNKPVVETQKEVHEPTLEDLMEAYLRREVDERTDRFPRCRVCIRPQYDDIRPAIAVEKYVSKQFLDEHRPSFIVAYEFVNGKLQENKLNELMGQYYFKRNVKLFIVSSFSLSPRVRALAMERNVGYIRLNPNSEVTSENYILPRSIEDYAKQQYDIDVLTGAKSMEIPILVMDGPKLTSSLTDVLSDSGVSIKNRRLLYIPFLSEDDIEKKVNALTEKDVDMKMHLLDKLNVDLSLDPFAYAVSYGLSYSEVVMEESQLGLLIVGNPNRVILNSVGKGDPTKALSITNPKHRSRRPLSIKEFLGGVFNEYNRKYNVRKRFTMAHELGHHILHSHIFNESGVVSVGESEDTLAITRSDSRRLEYQANKFASFLLMPRRLVVALYEKYYKEYYGGVVCPLYYNSEAPETWPGYDNIVGNLASTLQVSFQAMSITLQSLGLLKNA